MDYTDAKLKDNDKKRINVKDVDAEPSEITSKETDECNNDMKYTGN